MKQIALSISLAAVLLLAFFLGSQLPNTGTAQSFGTTQVINEPPRTITVNGSGAVTAAPDALVANVSVVSLETSLDEAIVDNNQKMAAISETLKLLGIDPKDIKTSNFSVYPEREKNRGPIVRYRVTNTLNLMIRDLESAGSILDQAVRAGANEIHGVRFTFSDPYELERQARLNAVEDAMNKATELVEAAGASLGKVLTISSHHSSPLRTEMAVMDFDMSEQAAFSAVPLEPGEMGLNISVSITLSIE